MLYFIKFLLILQIIILVETKRAYASYKDVECFVHDGSYFELLQCWMSKDARGQKTMNAIMILKKDITHLNVHYTFIMDRQGRNETYLSADIDICQALGDYHANFVKRIIAEEMHRVSNFPLDCPFKKGVKYSINNFTINSNYIPSFVPVLKWYTKAVFFLGKQKLFTCDSNGRVDHKRKSK